MTEKTGLAASQGLILTAGGGAAAIVALLYALGVFGGKPPAPEPQALTEEVASAQTAPVAAPTEQPATTGDTAAATTAPAPTAETTADPAPEASETAAETAEATAEEPVATPLPEAPRIDVVRVEADGSTLIAGTAAAGSEVDILLDEKVIETIQPGADGKFAAFLNIEPSVDPRLLGLILRLGDAVVRSGDQVIIAPVQPVVVAGVDGAESNPAAASDTAEAAAPDSVAETSTPEASDGAQTPAGEVEQAATTVAPVTDSPVTAASEGAPETPVETAEAASEGTPEVAEPAAEVATPPDTPLTVAETAGQGSDATGTPPQAQAGATAEVAQSTAAEDATSTPAADTAATLAADQPASETATAERTAPTEPAAPVVIIANEEGVKVVQPAQPASTKADRIADLILDAISYSDAGAVELAGRGQPDSFVRAYLNNRLQTEAAIAETGQWEITLDGIDAGIYTLRIDQLDASGKVTSRVETPFKREAEEKVAAANAAASTASQSAATVAGADSAQASDTVAATAAESAPATPPVRVVTVQPGNTLWAIARDHYGEGLLYVRVFQANRDLIRNPDLIYPGQVFTVPE